MNNKQIRSFDIEPVLIITDIYFDQFLKNEVLNMANKYADLFKTEAGLNKINSLLKEHTQTIINQYISSKYILDLHQYITDAALFLFIINRLTDQSLELIN